ncbi:MAG: host attachment protein, partial [Gammaproteobacteria bacterium]|nr:host attachment protein [Gammaproteobacteria bacterium]
CSAAEARLWRSTSRFGDWEYVTTMSNPSATKSEAEFASDRPGRAFDSIGAGRHSMSQPESGQQHEMLVFARRVADYLNRCIVKNEFAHIVLIGAPKFLGCLRADLSDPARRAVVMEASKNLGDLDSNAIKKYFE